MVYTGNSAGRYYVNTPEVPVSSGSMVVTPRKHGIPIPTRNARLEKVMGRSIREKGALSSESRDKRKDDSIPLSVAWARTSCCNAAYPLNAIQASTRDDVENTEDIQQQICTLQQVVQQLEDEVINLDLKHRQVAML